MFSAICCSSHTRSGHERFPSIANSWPMHHSSSRPQFPFQQDINILVAGRTTLRQKKHSLITEDVGDASSVLGMGIG